jgi:hypothetical protein
MLEFRYLLPRNLNLYSSDHFDSNRSSYKAHSLLFFRMNFLCSSCCCSFLSDLIAISQLFQMSYHKIIMLNYKCLDMVLSDSIYFTIRFGLCLDGPVYFEYFFSRFFIHIAYQLLCISGILFYFKPVLYISKILILFILWIDDISFFSFNFFRTNNRFFL